MRNVQSLFDLCPENFFVQQSVLPHFNFSGTFYY